LSGESLPCRRQETSLAHVRAGGSRMTARIALVAFALLLVACKDEPQEPLTGSYSGSTSGTRGGQAFSAAITFTLTQNGNQLTGTYTSPGGTTGEISGTVAGVSVTGTITQGSPCAGSFNTTAHVENSGRRLSGTYSGVGCGQDVTATFTVERN
jgi:hypothetical protein